MVAKGLVVVAAAVVVVVVVVAVLAIFLLPFMPSAFGELSCMNANHPYKYQASCISPFIPGT